MKKFLLGVTATALLSATLVSCGSETKKEEATVPVETTTTEVTTTTTEPVATDAPVFSSDEVNKGLAEYHILINEYTTALQNKDAAKVQELSTKYQAWAQSAATWTTKLKPEETQQYSEYMQRLAAEWAAAAQNAAK